jgi:hypothetical protein
MAREGYFILDSDLHLMEPHDLWERYLEGRTKRTRRTFSPRTDARRRRSKSSVWRCRGWRSRRMAAALGWPLPTTLTDRVLEAMLYAGPGTQCGSRRNAEPDWTHVHHELRRLGVTLMLLWEEYRQREPGGYGYSRWCELYRAWEGQLSPTMRHAHRAGERMFVDYAYRPAPKRPEQEGFLWRLPGFSVTRPIGWRPLLP